MQQVHIQSLQGTNRLLLLFSALITQDDGSTKEEELQTSVLLNKCTGDQVDTERVSTGTKHALHEWLKATAV